MKLIPRFFRVIGVYAVVSLIATILFTDLLHVRETQASMLGLTEPTQMLSLSRDYQAPILKGLKLNPSDIYDISFLVDSANTNILVKAEVQRLINYFLAGLAIDDKALWVNLSPYEPNRILDDNLENTELGRDMLAQDYILKQLSSSMTHPSKSLGKEYWENTDAVDNISKIWIVPGNVEVVERNNAVIVSKAVLDLNSNEYSIKELSKEFMSTIKDDVNHGKNFTKLRQIYNSLILAKWFKERFQDSVYRGYIEQNNLDGIDNISSDVKSKIWQLYCESFKKGVYDTIRADPLNKERRRRYFSGGLDFEEIKISSSLDVELTKIPVIGKLYGIKAFTRKKSFTTEGDSNVYIEGVKAKTIVPTALLSGKRVFDVTMALFFLVAFSPALLLTALWIKGLGIVNKKWAGPVFFNPTRVGKNGKDFTMYKFRTMYDTSEEKNLVEKPYLPGARFIRIFLDELPQLINIFKGEMSFVGPRPYDKKQNDFLGSAVPGWNSRMTDVLPGFFSKRALMVTSGKYKQQIVNEEEQFDNSDLGRALLELDLEYTGEQSLRTDLRLITASLLSVTMFEDLSYKLIGLSKEGVNKYAELYESYQNGGIDMMDINISNRTSDRVELAKVVVDELFSLVYKIDRMFKVNSLSDFALTY